MVFELSPFFKECSDETVMDASNSFKRSSIRSPLDHYLSCRDLLYRAHLRVTSSELETEFFWLRRYPYAEIYQPSIAALALLSKLFSKELSPICPKILPSFAPLGRVDQNEAQGSLLPLPIAYQLGCLWQQFACLEKREELLDTAQRVKYWARQFHPVSRWLFLSEELAFLAKDPFWRSAQMQCGQDRNLGLVYGSRGHFDAAWTLSGSNSGFGAMQCQEVAIHAFGPQVPPLSHTQGFGLSEGYARGVVIATEKSGFEIEGWSRCFADKEAWIFFSASMKEDAIDLLFRMQGSLSNRATLSFYVAAQSCSLESNQRFFPKSLNCFRGEIQPVVFNDRISFLPYQRNGEMQIIPLAGENCFWNANFLISYSLCSPLKLSIRS